MPPMARVMRVGMIIFCQVFKHFSFRAPDHRRRDRLNLFAGRWTSDFAPLVVRKGNYILDCMVGGALKQSKGKWHSLNVFYLFNNHRSRAYPFPQHETLSRVPGLYPM